MNRKCFCCFNNMNSNDKDDELLKDWIEFRFEKLESNLTDEDKKHALNYDTFCEKILDIIPDKDSDYVSDILDDFREELLNYNYSQCVAITKGELYSSPFYTPILIILF